MDCRTCTCCRPSVHDAALPVMPNFHANPSCDDNGLVTNAHHTTCAEAFSQICVCVLRESEVESTWLEHKCNRKTMNAEMTTEQNHKPEETSVDNSLDLQTQPLHLYGTKTFKKWCSKPTSSEKGIRCTRIVTCYAQCKASKNVKRVPLVPNKEVVHI